MALGPNGLIYLCNNGGRYSPVELGEWLFPGPYQPDRYTGGRIQTLDPTTGQIEDLYTECDGRPLWSPNDLVFDTHGGFYFTDHGLTDDAERIHHLSGIYYAAADGSSITEVVFPAHEPNGIGLSPDGSTLYWAQTWHGRIMRRDVSGPASSSSRRSPIRRSASTGSTGCSCSTRSPSTPTATCASPRSSTAASRSCHRRAS